MPFPNRHWLPCSISRRGRPARWVLPLAVGVVGALASAAPAPDHRAGSLVKDEPQAVYAADPDDPWNTIFYLLFTHTVRTRLSPDFPEGAPFVPVPPHRDPPVPVSRAVFERIEGGDRAIEPLSSPRFTPQPPRVLTELNAARLEKALTEALRENTPRPPLARALMQSDVWAAHDILARNYNFEGAEGKKCLERRDRLLPLLARFVKELALTREEIKALPDPYAAAAAIYPLPDLFGRDSAWMEVEWYPDRAHDDAADDRRAARVFIKPAAPPRDGLKYLNGLRSKGYLGEWGGTLTPQLAAVALLTQDLLIDRTGQVVPSRLTFELQVRTFVKDGNGKLVRTDLNQYELSRRLLLDKKAGGLVALDDRAPVYLPGAGNDYDFAAPQRGPGQDDAAVLARLRKRCASCHGGDRTEVIMTFNFNDSEPRPPVVWLKPSDNDHARYVARKKMERPDFKTLFRRWREE